MATHGARSSIDPPDPAPSRPSGPQSLGSSLAGTAKSFSRIDVFEKSSVTLYESAAVLAYPDANYAA